MLEKGLTSMGYRLMNGIIWGKPIGFHLLTFNTEKLEFINFFKSKNDEHFIWNSVEFHKEDTVDEQTFVKSLKYVERETKTDIFPPYNESDYEFLTLEEMYKFDL